jgi:hypothetical protein
VSSRQAVHYLNDLAMSQKYGTDWQELIGAAAASAPAGGEENTP